MSIHPVKSLIARAQNWQSRHYQYTVNGRRLAALKGMHAGQRCFIVANGPSLRAEDLDRLAERGEITFAMNRIFKLFNSTNWRPTYYTCEDINIFNDSIQEINAVPAKKIFIPVNLHWYYGINIDDALYFWANYDRERDFPNSFSSDIAKQMDSMGTVTFTCINIAAYMGFSEIYLIGVDHNYHITINEAGETVVDDTVKDYFCEDYDKDIINLQVHNMGQNTIAYKKAKTYCDEHNIKIYNATRGGKLEVYPRVDLDKLFM